MFNRDDFDNWVWAAVLEEARDVISKRGDQFYDNDVVNLAHEIMPHETDCKEWVMLLGEYLCQKGKLLK